MTQPGIEPQSPRPLVNTLLIRPMARLIYIYIYIYIYTHIGIILLDTWSGDCPICNGWPSIQEDSKKSGLQIFEN